MPTSPAARSSTGEVGGGRWAAGPRRHLSCFSLFLLSFLRILLLPPYGGKGREVRLQKVRTTP